MYVYTDVNGLKISMGDRVKLHESHDGLRFAGITGRIKNIVDSEDVEHRVLVRFDNGEEDTYSFLLAHVDDYVIGDDGFPEYTSIVLGCTEIEKVRR